MNKPFQRAQTLAEVALQVTTEPLQLGDPRYVDLSGGQDTKDLRQLRQYLEDQDARDNRFATAAFSGHRGCGKSTELLRLEHELEPRFTAVHLYVDDTLVRDIDYTDLLLWLVDSLATKFQADGMPLDSRLVDDVANWFAAAVVEDVDSLKAEVTAESTIEGQAKAGLYVVSLRILARLKSMVKGSIERRQTIRRQLQRYSTDLIGRVNLLLDDAARVLEKHGKEPDLLIVQDNLDRVAPDAARRLFIDNGDLLTSLHAHFIYTAPVALVLSPSNIGQVFEHRFTMPMVKTARPDGKPFRPGVDALIKLVDARVEIDDLFASRSVARFLARMSGGSVRDLMRLLDGAQSLARVDGKSQIDMASARNAVKRLRIDFERLLVPGQVYFPLLAAIHREKQLTIETEVDQDNVQAARGFFAELLLMGAVMEYNGDRCWYDVHPVVREIGPFQDAHDQD